MRTSPFVKSDSSKDVHFLVKKSKEAATNAHTAVTNIFPNSGDVPHSIRLYSALFYLGVVCAVFIYLFESGYNTALNTEFLSPYLGNNAPASSNCHLIPISHTGEFEISDDGFWEGSQKFSPNRATYRLAMTAYSATSDSFREEMTTVYSYLQHFGALAKTQALALNLMLWMSLVYANQTESSKRLTMSGDPLVVFNRDHTDGALSSIAGNCNVSNTASFDSSNGLMSVSWNYKNFIAEPKCMKALDPLHFGYNMMSKPKTFTLSFDIRTIVTGIAVNMGFITISQLEEIDKYRQAYVSNGRHIVVRYFYDPQYAGMQPLRCATANGGPPYCTFRVNDVVMFPMFRHLGANTTYPEVCDCTKLTLAELSDKTHNCNVFRFMSGFLFLSGPYSVSGNYANGLLAEKFQGSLSEMLLGAHHAMFIASSYGQASPLAARLNSPSNLAAVYDFCKFEGQTCSFLTFTSYDVIPNNWAVSKEYTLVTNGACTDTISPTAEQWKRAVDVPYGPLVQSYQQCKNDAYQTMINQAGIATGNIQVVAPLVVIFLMLVTWLHKAWNKVPLDESYTKAEKNSALDAYAMSLLLARDEKLKTQSFRGNNSIIALIAEELGEHTYLSTQSHKKHGNNFSMSNLSTHSLNSLTGPDSPPRNMMKKFFSSTASTTSSLVVPFEDVEMMKITTEHTSEQASWRSEKDEQEMSLREYIIAKKRGSLGDGGEGLSFAIRNKSFGGERSYHQVTSPKARGPNHATSPKAQHHSRQESSNFDAALGRVMQLEANFGKGPTSFGVVEDIP